VVLVQRFRGGLVLKAHRLCVSLNSRLESNKEEEEHEAATVKRSAGESEGGEFRGEDPSGNTYISSDNLHGNHYMIGAFVW